VVESRFDFDRTEGAGGRLDGLSWGGRRLRAGDMLSSAEVSYLRHVVARQEWPDGTTIEDYIQSIQEAIRNPKSLMFTSFYDAGVQLGFIAPSGQWRGRYGGDWIMVEYRVNTGHWVTAYQFSGPRGTIPRSTHRSNVRWQRR